MAVSQEILDKAYQLAYDYDIKFGCCPQCVLLAVQETIGIVTDELITASHTLSGGGGLRGEGTCGALAGGLLALGAKFGRPKERFGKGKFLKSFQAGKELMDWFKEEFKGQSCNDIQVDQGGKVYNMWDPQEIVEMKACTKEYCADLTGKVTVKVIEMISK